MDEPVDIFELISSPDNRKRNEGFRLLYKDEKVNNFIKSKLAGTNLDNVESKEILHDGLIILQRRIRANGFRQESKVQTYLNSICFNLIRSELRKRGKNKIDLVDEMPDDARRLELIESDITSSKREEENVEMFKVDLEKLKKDCIEVLREFHVDGLSNAQIAEKRNLSTPDQGKKKVYRCRKYLRKILSENPFYKR